jgi:predicted GNAT family acetyltransferase
MTGLHDNQDLGRYELVEQGQVVFANYRREGARLYIDHVEAPIALRGGGAAGRLMEALVAQARADRLTLVPICSYAVHWLRTHPALAHDVVSTGIQR